MSVLQQQSGDEEAFAYNNTLRRSIFDAYSGIFNGMSREKVNQFMPPYAPVSTFPDCRFSREKRKLLQRV